MAIKRYSENTKPDTSLNKIETYDFSEDEVFGYEKDEEMKVAVANEFADAVVARGTVDNLTSTDTDKALSANQGKVLNEGKENKSNKVTAFQETPDDTHYPSEKLVNDSLDTIKGTGWTDENLADHEVRIHLIEQTLDAYGVIYDRDTDSFERTGLTVGMSYTYDTVGSVTTVVSDFDDVPIFQWKRCNLADNMTVNAYYGDPTYIEDGSNGQVMVEIPKFYYYAKKDGNTYHYLVADKPLAEFRLHPAFIRDGVIKEHIYVGAFEATGYDGTSYFGDGAFDNSLDYLASVAGLQPLSGNTTSFNIVQARTMAQNRGFNWNLKDFLGWSAYQLMQTIEFASFNSQSFLSAGITSLASGTGNHSQNTGHTSTLGNSSGYVNFPVENGATGQTTRNAPSYRGIENPFGNIWEFVDGINITELLVYIADHGFASDTFTDPYKPIGYVGDTSGYMSEHMFSSLSDFGFLPISVVGGGSGSYFCDYYYVSTATNRIALVGGNWHDSVTAGAFFWYLSNSSATSDRSIAARLFAF